MAATSRAEIVPTRRRNSQGPEKRLLQRHLLVELEADQQRQRIPRDQLVGIRVAGERQHDGLVGHDAANATRRVTDTDISWAKPP